MVWPCNIPNSETKEANSLPFSFNSNNKIHTGHINIHKVNKLTLGDTKPDKFDFFFTDIDENTTLDVNFNYYDITDFNKMTPISQKIDFSKMHTNIQFNWNA